MSTTGWDEPVQLATVSSLFPILIKHHNHRNPQSPLPHARLHALGHIHATTLLLAIVPLLLAIVPVHVVASAWATPPLRSL